MPSTAHSVVAALVPAILLMPAVSAAQTSTPTPTITTSTEEGALARPGGLALDGYGNLFIADTNHHQVRRIDSRGVATVVAGTGVAGVTGEGGPATLATLNAPAAVAVDGNGNLFIADTGNHCIRFVSALTGVITRVAGSCGVAGVTGDAPRSARESWLDHPTGVAVDPSGLAFYIADRDSHRVRKVSGGVMTTYAGNSTLQGRPPFFQRLHCPITSFFAATPGSTPGAIGGYYGDGGPASAAGLRCPSGVAVDGSGNVYIADTGNVAIRRVTPDGVITTVAGGHSYNFSWGFTVEFHCGIGGDGGPATAAHLCNPVALSFDALGTMYIADTGNHRIRQVTPGGVITTIAGSGVTWQQPPLSSSAFPAGEAGLSGDGGPATYAHLNQPSGVAVTPNGDVLISDAANDRLRLMPRSDVPVTGDIDGDGTADLIVWRPSSGTWFWLTSSSGFDYSQARSRQWGSARDGDVPLVGDVDGDGRGDLIAWRASTGSWYWLTSSSGYAYDQAGMRQWGSAALGDVPFVGDFDADARADLTVWRRATGTWFWLTSSTGYDYAAQRNKQLGASTDVPLLGDTDGDGLVDLVVWRPGDGTWLRLTSSTAFDDAQRAEQQWGAGSAGDVPVLSDVDGDRILDLAVWRAPTGTWYSLSSRAQYDPNLPLVAAWGAAALGDVPLVMDLDGDRRGDFVVWRASSGTFYWLASSTGYVYGFSKPWGSSR